MRLNVSVRDSHADGVPTPVVVDTEPTATVGRLTAELARAIGAAGDAVLYSGAGVIKPDLTLQAAGLRDGADLGLGTPVPVEPEAEGHTEIRVVSGPDAGTIFRVTPGDYDISGAPDARIRLSAEVGSAVRVRVHLDGSADLIAAEHALIDGEPAEPGAEWHEGNLVAIGDVLLALTSRRSNRAPVTAAADGLGLEFNRPPRFLPDAAGDQFRLPSPPAKPDKRPFPLVPILLLPLASSLVTILATGRWTFIFIALLSPIGALASQFSGRKQGMRRYLDQRKEHEEKLAVVEEDVRDAVLAEQRDLRLARPDPASLLQMAIQPSERLWERRWSDPDFLTVRIGTTDLPSSVSVEDPTRDEHRRTTVPTLSQVPVEVALRSSGIVGVAGPGAGDLTRWIVAQSAALHSPADLRIVILPDSDGERGWSWTRWLPHAQARGEDAYALVGSTADSLARRIGELGQLVASRVAAGPELARGGINGYPDVVVVLEQARRARSLPGVVGLLRDGPGVGVYVVCLDSEERLLPEECGAVISTDADYRMTCILRTSGGAPLEQIRGDDPDADWYEPFARALAPLRGVGDTDDSVLPGSVRLLDLLGIEPPSAEALAAGWALGGRSTTATIGAGYDGPFAVDLVRDGPHALIAGTTGSGKSELLQSLVATLAVVNRPDEMTFVLIDYKGGSAFAECTDLPHTVGLVTDLDSHLVERALVSLGAELRRRETVLASAGAKDIVDYLDKRTRGGDTLPPLPRLMLVIDEFASMVRELPDFITGLVNIAQRGRSLGIHLVLATQRPGGAVTPDIRANTNLRIALRTTDTSESRDIIDAPDAGQISSSTPGRAYARLGPSALLPFQSARVGGRRPGGVRPEDATVPVSASAVSWHELGGPLPPGAQPREESDSPTTQAVTDLSVLASAIAEAARAAGLDRQPSPWLPPLPEQLLWTRPDDPAPSDSREAALPPVEYGLVDRPAEQSRVPLMFDLDRVGHLHIVGSARSGRSQALRTLAAALATAHGADDVHLYGVDGGNGALNALSSLPHSGAVVDRNELERLTRLLDRLNTELTARQRLLGANGMADLTELRKSQSPEERLPHIVVLVDRFEVLDRELVNYDNGSLLDRLNRLLRDGVSVGLHVVLAGDKVLGNGRYSGTTEDKLVLRLNDRQDYSSVGIPTRSAPVEPGPGRAMRTADLTEAQIAVLADDLSGSAQAQVLTALGEGLSKREKSVAATRRAFQLDVLPDVVSYADAMALHTRRGPMLPLVAIGGDDLTSLGPDLADVPTFVIAGPPRTGRSTALLAAAQSVLAEGAGVVVLAPRRSPLRQLEGQPGVAGVIVDPEVSVVDFRKVLGNVPQPHGIIVIDDAELLTGAEIDPDLAALARGAQGNGWGLLVAGNAEALGFSLSGWTGQVKRNRTGLLLSPQNLGDGEIIGIRLSRGLVGQAPMAGRGLLHLGDSRLLPVQVPQA